MKRVITLFSVVCVFFFCTFPTRAQDTNSSDEIKQFQILSDSPEYAYLYALKAVNKGDTWSQVVAVRIIRLLKENNRLLSEIKDILSRRTVEGNVSDAGLKNFKKDQKNNR